MILVVDSGAGGIAVREHILVNTGYSAEDIVLHLDTPNFPYGNKTVEFLQQRYDAFVAQFQPDLTVIACNTMSLSVKDVERQLKVLPRLNPGDILLGSMLTCMSMNTGIPCSDLIADIQDYHESRVSKQTLKLRITQKLEPIAAGSSVYLGCTHFSYCSNLFAEARSDINFIEPNYAELTIAALSK